MYFDADRYSPIYNLGDRPLYTGLLTDIPGSSVAYRSAYTLSLTDIPVCTPGDRPLYSRLQTNILDNSVADRYSYTFADQYSGMYSRWLAVIPGYSVPYRSYYTLLLTDILVQMRGCYTLS